MIENHKTNIHLKYLIVGILFGMLFPAFAWTYELVSTGLTLSFDNCKIIIADNPLIIMITTAPVFLGLFALVGGINHARVIKEKDELSRITDLLKARTEELNAVNASMITDLERLKYLTCYDQLTGIYNRVFFEGELDRFNRTRQLPLSLIMADINGLKLINDTFGHDVGDKALQDIAKILKSLVRSEDIVARIGGDEFAIILPLTSKETTLEIINNINTKCNIASDKPTKVSVSLGYATKTDNGCSIQEMVKEADEHMCKRKLMEGKSAHSELVSSLILTLKKSSFETNEHAERMKSLSLKLGNKMNLSESQMDDLLLLAVLHDLGKVGISDKI
ncbi:MAG TPA: diguanylate cyclase, partial [Anaerovoracaceae bacterium]|nr:diguanylate cyclase [Anaerovoracaceae bacterium]